MCDIYDESKTKDQKKTFYIPTSVAARCHDQRLTRRSNHEGMGKELEK